MGQFSPGSATLHFPPAPQPLHRGPCFVLTHSTSFSLQRGKEEPAGNGAKLKHRKMSLARSVPDPELGTEAQTKPTVSLSLSLGNSEREEDKLEHKVRMLVPGEGN